MDATDRRRDNATAEKIDMVLKTRRAFDDHAALRFVELAAVPEDLARQVLQRPVAQTRQFDTPGNAPWTAPPEPGA